MPLIRDARNTPGRSSTIYPEAFRKGLEGRYKRALTEGLGLTQFGINLTTLDPGGRSSQRHWHRSEDEAVFILQGEVVLVTEAGEQTLRAGDVAGFPAGVADGHCLVNRSSAVVHYLEIGTRASEEEVDYPDIDLKAVKQAGVYRFLRKDGSEYE